MMLFALTTSLPAQITREQADAIVLEYLSDVVHYSLYVNSNTPNKDGFTMTTLKGETIKAKYACWVYFTGFEVGCAKCADCPCPHRFLFVKEDNGSVLEVITTFGLSGDNPWEWQFIGQSGLIDQKENNKSLYPNPVDDWLTIPCNGENTRVEIYDLKGTCLFSKELSDNQLNVSSLNPGMYMVKVSGETYKIIKK